MARYKAAALLFTCTVAEQNSTALGGEEGEVNKPMYKRYALLVQQDPAWRAHRIGHATADMPAMFPGGMVDRDELTKTDEPAATFARYAKAAFPSELLKAEAAAAAMREVFEETGIHALEYDADRTLQFVDSIKLEGNTTKHVGIFAIDAGTLDQEKFKQLKASLTPKEDCITAAFVPLDNITASCGHEKEGSKTYTVKDYLLHRKMRHGYEKMPYEHVGENDKSPERSILREIDTKRKHGRLNAGLNHTILSRYDVPFLPSNGEILEKFLGKGFEEVRALQR